MRDVEKRGHFSLLAGEIKRWRCVYRPLQVMAIRLGSLVKSCKPATGPGLAMSPSLEVFDILTFCGALTSQKITYRRKGRFLFLKLFFTAIKVRSWRCFPQTFFPKERPIMFLFVGVFPLQVLPGWGGRGGWQVLRQKETCNNNLDCPHLSNWEALTACCCQTYFYFFPCSSLIKPSVRSASSPTWTSSTPCFHSIFILQTQEISVSRRMGWVRSGLLAQAKHGPPSGCPPLGLVFRAEEISVSEPKARRAKGRCCLRVRTASSFLTAAIHD